MSDSRRHPIKKRKKRKRESPESETTQASETTRADELFEAAKQQNSYKTLGAVSKKDKEYFKPTKEAKANAAHFLHNFWENEQCTNAAKEYYRAKPRIAHNLVAPSCLAFVTLIIEEKPGKSTQFCLVALSGSSEMKEAFLQLREALSNYVDNYNQKYYYSNQDLQTSITEETKQEILSPPFVLLGNVLANKKSININKLLQDLSDSTSLNKKEAEKGCAEKVFLPELVKLFRVKGDKVKITGIVNCEFAPYTTENMTQSPFGVVRKQNTSTPYEDVSLSENKTQRIYMIACCQACTRNKKAALSLLAGAQFLGRKVEQQDINVKYSLCLQNNQSKAAQELQEKGAKKQKKTSREKDKEDDTFIAIKALVRMSKATTVARFNRYWDNLAPSSKTVKTLKKLLEIHRTSQASQSSSSTSSTSISSIRNEEKISMAELLQNKIEELEPKKQKKGNTKKKKKKKKKYISRDSRSDSRSNSRSDSRSDSDSPESKKIPQPSPRTPPEIESTSQSSSSSSSSSHTVSQLSTPAATTTLYPIIPLKIKKPKIKLTISTQSSRLIPSPKQQLSSTTRITTTLTEDERVIIPPSSSLTSPPKQKKNKTRKKKKKLRTPPEIESTSQSSSSSSSSSHIAPQAATTPIPLRPPGIKKDTINISTSTATIMTNLESIRRERKIERQDPSIQQIIPPGSPPSHSPSPAQLQATRDKIIRDPSTPLVPQGPPPPTGQPTHGQTPPEPSPSQPNNTLPTIRK